MGFLLKRTSVIVLLVATVIAWPALAANEPPISPAEQPPSSTIRTSATPSSWYGYQTLAADGLAIALAVLAERKNSAPMLMAGVGLYFVGAPTIHGLHRRPGAVSGSLGLRIAMPLIVSALASATADCRVRVVNDETCDFGEKIVGGAIGLGLAMILDSALLSWAPAPATALASAETRTPTPPAWAISLAPVLTRQGAGLALGGIF